MIPSRYQIRLFLLGSSLTVLMSSVAAGNILSGGLSWAPVTDSTNWSYNDIIGEFSTGGQFEGYRHASLAEVRSLVESYGFDSLASPEENSQAIMDLQADFGSTSFSTLPQFQYWTLGLTADATRIDLSLVLPLVDSPETWLGSVYETLDPSLDIPSPQVGHFLVYSVPEPSLMAGILGLAALLLAAARRRLRS